MRSPTYSLYPIVSNFLSYDITGLNEKAPRECIFIGLLSRMGEQTWKVASLLKLHTAFRHTYMVKLDLYRVDILSSSSGGRARYVHVLEYLVPGSADDRLTRCSA